jgi:N6-L-threonylcarbamoyladenine synthase
MSCILALESSCDETAAAVVDGALRVRGGIVASQHELHAEYGGVVPEIASRAHLERLVPVLDRCLREARVGIGEITAVSVGIRPGLIGSLLVGTSAAKALAWSLRVPFYAVDHVAAHLFAGLLQPSDARPDAVHGPSPHGELFPALGLVVSGGHTSLFRVESPVACELVGRTIDDAVGEALDKAAAMLGLGHPGGPRLEACARAGDANALRFALPQLANNLDFSLSGLKTKLLYEVRGVPQGRGAAARFPRSAAELSDARRADLAASFQRAAIAQVVDRLARAHDEFAPKALFVGGGVVANSVLRSELAEFARSRGIALVVPEPAHCVDNAAMIGGFAQLRRALGDAGDDLSIPAEPVSRLARGSTAPGRSLSAKRVQ